METKEIQVRLEIIKLATTIGDHEVITLESEALKSVGSSKINEIISLLSGRNYRQALYLIKNYLSDMGINSEIEVYESSEDETERVLDIEDMLKMSPLAKDTIKDYKRSIYTNDDLAAFSKNIERPLREEYEQKLNSIRQQEESPKSNFIKEIEEEAKENLKAKAVVEKEDKIDEEEYKNVNSAIDDAHKDTPLDEISAEVLSLKNNKNNPLSKYKKLREKFAKRDSKNNITLDDINEKESQEPKETNISTNTEDKVKINEEKKEDTTNKDTKDTKNKENKETKDSRIYKEVKDKELSINDNVKDNNISKEKEEAEIKKDSEIIYAPIPHIEQKFRQAFILFPPLKESEIWVEEAVKFLKHISKNSFTERDVKILLDDYNFYLEKKDIAKAAQILLLAASTESEFAKFILARELFKGKVVVRDLKKSFELMKSLANKFYPDAVCDLAQFYEYGIGVPKDKSVAIKLYEKAFQLGVARATKHINRLKESNSFFSTIFKMK